jgi:hypothetical protein
VRPRRGPGPRGPAPAVLAALAPAPESPRAGAAYAHTAADGRRYYLHGAGGAGRRGGPGPRYWFARRAWAGATLAAVPEGWRVAESPLTGRPYLRRA